MKWPSFLRKIGTYFSVVTKIRENVPDKANDLRLVSREPQEIFGPERVFCELPRSFFTSSYFTGSARERALLFEGFILSVVFFFNGSIVFGANHVGRCNSCLMTLLEAHSEMWSCDMF